MFGAILGGISSMFGANSEKKRLGATDRQMKQFMATNPQGFQNMFGGMEFGEDGGQFNMSPEQKQLMQQMQGGIGNQFNGGMAQNGDLMTAMNQNNMTSAMQNANGLNNQQMGNSAFGGLVVCLTSHKVWLIISAINLWQARRTSLAAGRIKCSGKVLTS